MAKPLLFVGSRSRLNALAIVAEYNGFEVVGTLDHHYYGNRDEIAGVPVIGDERWLLDKDNAQAQSWLRECAFFPATWPEGRQVYKSGPNMDQLRLDRIDILEKSKAKVINLIHPKALAVEDLFHPRSTSKLGKGIFLAEGVYIGPTNVNIGDYCMIETNAQITHDVTFGRNVIVGPESFISSTTVGENSYLGALCGFDFKRGCTSINIGNNVTVWTRAIVNRDIADNSVYTDTNRILKKIKTDELR